MEINKRREAKFSIISYAIIFYVLIIPFAQVLVNIVTKKFGVTSQEFINYVNTSPILSHETFTQSPIEKAYLMFSSLSNVFVYIILIVVLLFLNRKSLLISLKEIKSNYKNLLIIAFYGFLAYMAINFLVGTLNDLFNVETDSQNQILLELMIKHGYFIPTIFAAVICGPIVEELIFRKSIYAFLEQNIVVARIVSSIVFASIHLVSSLSIGLSFTTILMLTLPYFLFGFLFAILYEKAKFNIIPAILIHLITNLISILVIYY